jgi:hypothetical protein
LIEKNGLEIRKQVRNKTMGGSEDEMYVGDAILPV